MGYKRGWDAVNLRPVDRVPLLGLVDSSLLRDFYGVKASDAFTRYKILDVDLVYTHGVRKAEDKPRKLKPKTGFFEDFKEEFPFTDVFPVAYRGLKLARTESASQLWVVERPFKTYGEMVRYLRSCFDPLSWEERSLEDLVENYRYSFLRLQKPLKDTTLVAGELYLTLFTFFIVHIGHSFLLMLLYRNPEVFLEAAEKYAELAEMHSRAWAETGIKVFVSHDDIALKDGPMMAPSVFEEQVAPFYRRIWRPLREKGIKVLFVSDGKYLKLIDSLAEMGAQGFKINWDARLKREEVEALVEKYGGRFVLSLGPSYEVLSYGSPAQAKKEALWLVEVAKRRRGFFLSNVIGKPENVRAFWKTWLENNSL